MTDILTLHHAPLVLPVATPPIREGCVAVRDGRILWVGPSSRSAEAVERFAPLGSSTESVEWSGVLLPGLVNAHTHLQYTQMAEIGRGRYQGFEDWSKHFGAMYWNDSHDWETAAHEGARALRAAGTTAAADIVTNIEAGGALHHAGLRGVEYWEVLGQDAARWETGGRETAFEQLARLRERTSLPVGLSPHAPYSLDGRVIREIADYARAHDVRTHIHLSESAVEDEYVRSGTGPLSVAWGARHDFEIIRSGGTGRSSAQYTEGLGLLGQSCHIAHGIYLTAEDRAILRAQGTSAALCPRSNDIIGLNEPPVRALLEEGNSIAVGTDSLSSSPSLNVLEDVAELYRLARAQGYTGADLAFRLLKAATLGGAQAMGLGHSFGTLAPGAEAHLAVLATASLDPREATEEITSSGTMEVQATLVSGVVVGQLEAPSL